MMLLMILALVVTLLPTAVHANDYAKGYSAGTYVVQRGDTLHKIARAHGTTVYAIVQANGLYDKNRIEVGQHLHIPHSHYGKQVQVKHTKPRYHYQPPASQYCAAYHVVYHGETLSKIAYHYGIDAYDLAKANGIYDLNHLYRGQKLCIPAKEKYRENHAGAPAYQKPAHPKVVIVSKPAPHEVPTPHSKYAPENPPLNYDPWAHGQGYKPYPQQHYKPHYQPHYPKPMPEPKKPVMSHQGWKGSYFAHTQCGGDPLYTRHDPDLYFDWGYGGPGGGLWNDYFSVAWTTDAHFYAGNYRFHAKVDDGVRVYVDGHLVIDAWKEQAATSYTGDIWLSEGYHHVRVEYFEKEGVASIHVYWNQL